MRNQPSNLAYFLDFAALGEDVTIYPYAKVIQAERITLGDSVIIDDFAFIMAGAGLQIGSFVHIATHAGIAGAGEVTMGDFSCISGGSRIYTSNDDYLGGSLTNSAVPPKYRTVDTAPVHLGKHVLIGATSVVLPGVTIGEGAVVGANSLVKSDLEPWGVYAGTPARRIKDRPRSKIIELEAQLRAELYDLNGRYIPLAERIGS